MADWSALPNLALVLIARSSEHIEDFMAFRQTCSSWRKATTLKDFERSFPRVPLLLIKDAYLRGVEDLDVYCLSRMKSCTVLLPEAKHMKWCSGSKGWLIMRVGSEVMSLYDPITRTQIPLPNHPRSEYPCSRARLSDSPSTTDNYVVMILCTISDSVDEGPVSFMGFWKPGDLTWTQVETPYEVDDMKFYLGNLYALTQSPSHILKYNIFGPNPTEAATIIDLPWNGTRPDAYLVELEGKLVVVATHYSPDFDSGRDLDLAMMALDVTEGTCTNITSLGNCAIFLGQYDEGFSLDATRFHGINPGCIYFGDDRVAREAICGIQFGRPTNKFYVPRRSSSVAGKGVWFY